MAHPLVHYVVVRRDLWPWGAMVGQVCHATSALSWKLQMNPINDHFEYHSRPEEIRIVETENGESLRQLGEELRAKGIYHVCWLEQPENIETCLAAAPAEEDVVASLFKDLPRFTRRDPADGNQPG